MVIRVAPPDVLNVSEDLRHPSKVQNTGRLFRKTSSMVEACPDMCSRLRSNNNVSRLESMNLHHWHEISNSPRRSDWRNGVREWRQCIKRRRDKNKTGLMESRAAGTRARRRNKGVGRLWQNLQLRRWEGLRVEAAWVAATTTWRIGVIRLVPKPKTPRTLRRRSMIVARESRQSEKGKPGNLKARRVGNRGSTSCQIQWLRSFQVRHARAS